MLGRLSFRQLQQVEAKDDQKSFSFDKTGTLIHANQGHGVSVDLQLEAIKPPNILYHGIYQDAASLIEKQGRSKLILKILKIYIAILILMRYKKPMP